MTRPPPPNPYLAIGRTRRLRIHGRRALHSSIPTQEQRKQNHSYSYSSYNSYRVFLALSLSLSLSLWIPGGIKSNDSEETVMGIIRRWENLELLRFLRGSKRKQNRGHFGGRQHWRGAAAAATVRQGGRSGTMKKKKMRSSRREREEEGQGGLEYLGVGQQKRGANNTGGNRKSSSFFFLLQNVLPVWPAPLHRVLVWTHKGWTLVYILLKLYYFLHPKLGCVGYQKFPLPISFSTRTFFKLLNKTVCFFRKIFLYENYLEKLY